MAHDDDAAYAFLSSEVKHTVKIPSAVYDELERKAVRLHQLETALATVEKKLRGYTILAVTTDPPSGGSAYRIASLVRDLVSIAQEYKP